MTTVFTHAENLSLLALGTIQGMGIALIAVPHLELPNLLVIVASLPVGIVLAAVEFSVIAKVIKRFRGGK
jgi:hypothetical protein